MPNSGEIARIQITDLWKPEDEDDAIQRAIFFAHSLNGHLRQNLLRMIDRCDAGEFGTEARPEIEELAFDEAVKEITSSLIYLVGFDQGGTHAPQWLNDFLFASQEEADSICPEPPAVEVIERRWAMTADEMIGDIEKSVSSTLRIADFPEVRSWLREFLQFTHQYTNELLALCLSQPIEALNKHLQMYTE